MTEPAPDPAPSSGWEPGYVTWASSVYAGAAVGSVAASRLSPLVAAETAGWGLPALVGLLGREGAAGPALYLSVAMLMVLISVLPGLLSLFLITLTDIRLALHPVVGAIFFALTAGLVSQSAGGAVFGFVFGLSSLGTSALLLALRRAFDLSRNRG